MPIYVKDIMVKPVITIDQEKTVKQAGELMKKTRRGCVLITRKGKLVGILSDSDIIKRVIAKNLLPSKVKVKEIMSSPLITIGPDEDVLSAVRKMKKNNIHRLPVVSGGKLVGIISLSDIAKTSPEMLDLLEYRIKMKSYEPEIKEKTTSGICDSCDNYSDDLQNVNGQWLCESCREEFEHEY
ncbi:MAG: CBS domain-containing protein [Candidatus Aenigmatarchaeota archaeon]